MAHGFAPTITHYHGKPDSHKTSLPSLCICTASSRDSVFVTPCSLLIRIWWLCYTILLPVVTLIGTTVAPIHWWGIARRSTVLLWDVGIHWHRVRLVLACATLATLGTTAICRKKTFGKPIGIHTE
jgi:hypothetical protein